MPRLIIVYECQYLTLSYNSVACASPSAMDENAETPGLSNNSHSARPDAS